MTSFTCKTPTTPYRHVPHFSSLQDQITSQIMEQSSPWKAMNQTPIPHMKFGNSSLQAIFALYWLQEPVMLHVVTAHYSYITILSLSLVLSEE